MDGEAPQIGRGEGHGFRMRVGWVGAGLSGVFAGGYGVVVVAAVDEAAVDTGGAGAAGWTMTVRVEV
jgi:hypothetical protein